MSVSTKSGDVITEMKANSVRLSDAFISQDDGAAPAPVKKQPQTNIPPIMCVFNLIKDS